MPVELEQGSLLACTGDKRDFSPSGIPWDPAARLSHVHKNMWIDTAALFFSKPNRSQSEKEERTDGSGPLEVRTLQTVWSWRHVALFICFSPIPEIKWIKRAWKKNNNNNLYLRTKPSFDWAFLTKTGVSLRKAAPCDVKGGAQRWLFSAYVTLNNAPFQMVDPVNPPKTAFGSTFTGCQRSPRHRTGELIAGLGLHRLGDRCCQNHRWVCWFTLN